ncbi:MAG: hypothetical protein KKA32_00510 [Actinobacteria bacterium]|nr:hypothetical protein [Actinomycetota bacterium]
MTAETDTPCIEVNKGTKDRFLVRPWENGRYTYVSLAQQTMSGTGAYVFMRGRSLAMAPDEARELAAALVSMAELVDAGMDESREP